MIPMLTQEAGSTPYISNCTCSDAAKGPRRIDLSIVWDSQRYRCGLPQATHIPFTIDVLGEKEHRINFHIFFVVCCFLGSKAITDNPYSPLED